MLKDNFDNELVVDVFDDDKIFDDFSPPPTKDSSTSYVESMELKNFENHDYIVFAFDDYRDFILALQYLDIPKVNVSFSPKIKKIGIGRVLDGKKLVGLFRH